MHLSFPFALQNGKVKNSTRERYIEQLMEQILFTIPGERVNRPTFGCGVEYMVFKQLSDEILAATLYIVQSELQRFMAGVATIQTVTVSRLNSELLINVDYIDPQTGAAKTAHYKR